MNKGNRCSWRLITSLSLLIIVTAIASIFVPSEPAQAAEIKTLYSFCSKAKCADGEQPSMIIQAIDGDLYGVSNGGGACAGCGTVFKITLGGALTTLYSFCAQVGCSDGDYPAGLVQAPDGDFYGTTLLGGDTKDGTVYKITSSGDLTQIHSMAKISKNPNHPLIQASNGNFYGNAEEGGKYKEEGAIYKITPAGKLSTLYSFCSQSGCPDGDGPESLIQGADGNFYGTTAGGGNCEFCGTFFKIIPDGVDSTLTTLHSFCAQSGCPDGQEPVLGLLQATDGNFYGTTNGGGVANSSCGGGCGTVFKITPAGLLTTLYKFCSQADCVDGLNPGGLIQGSDGDLYGTTTFGGVSSNCESGCGTVFKLTLDGELTTLYTFCQKVNCADGALPLGLIQDTNGTFFGTTLGQKEAGTVFSLSLGLGAFVEAQNSAGVVGESVKVLGTNLTGSTAVTFNGRAATFNVVSSSEITATVPAGATSGYIKVATPHGTLKSNTKFVVAPSSSPS